MNDHRAISIVVRSATLAAAELRAFWETLPAFGEVWIERADGTRACALLSGRRAWLMYLRHAGDAGFSSRDSRYSGPPDATLEFVLGNGQVDRYPRVWTYPADEILHAVEQFAADGTFPLGLQWHNDSADGACAPVAR